MYDLKVYFYGVEKPSVFQFNMLDDLVNFAEAIKLHDIDNEIEFMEKESY